MAKSRWSFGYLICAFIFFVIAALYAIGGATADARQSLTLAVALRILAEVIREVPHV